MIVVVSESINGTVNKIFQGSEKRQVFQTQIRTISSPGIEISEEKESKNKLYKILRNTS